MHSSVRCTLYRLDCKGVSNSSCSALLSILHMQDLISNDVHKRVLSNDTLGELVEEVASQVNKSGPDRIVVNLSNNDLTLPVLRKLVDLLRSHDSCRTTLALDVSLNRIQASRKEISPLIAALLKESHNSPKLVRYLNLSLNYLPALETLNDRVKADLYSYGKHLSLGFDYQMLVGTPEVDYWTLNAREFARIAYNEQY